MDWCAFDLTSAFGRYNQCIPPIVSRCVQALALHGALVTLTDLPVCLELMRHNVAINLPDQHAGEMFSHPPGTNLTC
jgi:hypothetical protein